MGKKRHNLFIAYHGTFSNSNGSKEQAQQLYDYLKERDSSLDIFFFPMSNQRNYQRNIAEVMNSDTFIFVAGPGLITLENGKIDPSSHYELLMEIDSFYCMTLSDLSTKAEDALVLGVNHFNMGCVTDLHPLFNGLDHLQANCYEDYENVYTWLKDRLSLKNKNSYLEQNESNEVFKVFRRRSQAFESMNFTNLIAECKTVRAIGISISELTRRFVDPYPIERALLNGAHFELLFLDPNSQETKNREKEEQIREGKISFTTLENVEKILDLKSSLPDKIRNNLSVRYYKAVPRLNFIQVDDISFLQYYGNFAQGIKNPCFVLVKNGDNNPILDYCLDLFERIKSSSWEVEL